MANHADALASFLRDRLGDNLRAVGFYREGDDEWVYLREDLRPEYPPDLLAILTDEARTVHGCLETVSNSDVPIGSSQASLYAFDGALLAHFFLAEGTGVVVSFEPDVGGRLHAFVDRCREILEEGPAEDSPAPMTRSTGSDCDPQAAE